jgi:hypothetical protein
MGPLESQPTCFIHLADFRSNSTIMMSATSVPESRTAPAGRRGVDLVGLLRSVGSFGALCVDIVQTARDLENAATDRERRQIAARPIGARRAA